MVRFNVRVRVRVKIGQGPGIRPYSMVSTYQDQYPVLRRTISVMGSGWGMVGRPRRAPKDFAGHLASKSSGTVSCGKCSSPPFLRDCQVSRLLQRALQ